MMNRHTPKLITVETGARLHFGLFATLTELGRSFGGVGLMINPPGCHLTVAAADHDHFAASDDLAQRLAEWLATYRARCPVKWRPPFCHITVRDEIPLHTGLGAGTQTALALATALTRLTNEPDIPTSELAQRVERGRRSAIGLHGFEQGGLLAEAGKRQLEEISPLQSRVDFPADWRLLLVTPQDRCGLSGDPERTAFARLGPMPFETTQRLQQIAEHELIPAVAARDFEATATALFEFGRLNGDYFSPVQGGLFANSYMADLAAWLANHGCRGVGQSSWGPTLYALCRDPDEAADRLRQVSSRMPHDTHVYITAPRNHGVRVSVG